MHYIEVFNQIFIFIFYILIIIALIIGAIKVDVTNFNNQAIINNLHKLTKQADELIVQLKMQTSSLNRLCCKIKSKDESE